MNPMLPDATIPTVASAVIVDDSALHRRHGADLCRELGIALVHEAANGREVLALLDVLDPAPNVLIVDLEMPTMDGPELLEHLAQRGISLPIILASSRERALIESVQDMAGALGLHVVAALQKPLRIRTLRAALQDLGCLPARRHREPKRLPIDGEALRTGLERGEILAYYHPQVELSTGNVRGLEALARWHHPTLGFVPPDQFIPLAEQSGLIHRLTLQILDQAILQTNHWNSQGLDLTIAVNLSPLLLERSDLVQDISDLQRLHGVPADHIVLEVTETSVMREIAVALGVLTRLRLRGFGLSLDDYGTGFSSMQRLARIPFTELKIDRSFVHGAHERSSSQVILRSAIELADKLGLSAVAEGVECMPDWRLLQDFGCTLAQGWLTAKPMPAAEFTPWLKRHLARKGELRSSAVTGRGSGRKYADAQPARD
jgi:EAL domain-containing protein (putative c-di-GMP-specific phosphodiesterase class I)